MATHPSATTGEKQEVIARLRSSREVFLRAVAGISDEQAVRRPAGDCWSILECAEHVTIAEQFMTGAVEKRRPAASPPDRSKDQLIRAVGLDRTRKLVAPERSRPAGRFATLADAVAAFEAARAHTIALAENMNEDWRATTVKHALAGVIDSYQALLLIALHSERHADQIEKMKA
jgi:hypothetical protein